MADAAAALCEDCGASLVMLDDATGRPLPLPELVECVSGHTQHADGWLSESGGEADEVEEEESEGEDCFEAAYGAPQDEEVWDDVEADVDYGWEDSGDDMNVEDM